MERARWGGLRATWREDRWRSGMQLVIYNSLSGVTGWFGNSKVGGWWLVEKQYPLGGGGGGGWISP